MGQAGSKNKDVKVKVCGITKYSDLQQLVEMGVDYNGFVFYEQSPRHVAGKLSAEQARQFTGKIRKTGVFVNAAEADIRARSEAYELDVLQLHGDESPAFCKALRASLPVIKAFRIKEPVKLDEWVKPYLEVCDYFLFDTGGKHYGGSGELFDWTVLHTYTGTVPFFLSGGIGSAQAAAIKAFTHPSFFAIDINSRFEEAPGVKNMNLIKKFLWELKEK